jgi:hypothetical protein
MCAANGMTDLTRVSGWATTIIQKGLSKAGTSRGAQHYQEVAVCCSPTTAGASSYGADGGDAVYKILVPDVFEAPGLNDFTARMGLTSKEGRHASDSSFQEVSNDLKTRYICARQDGRVLAVKVAPGEITIIGHIGGVRNGPHGAFIPQEYIVGVIDKRGFRGRPNPCDVHRW